MCTNAVVYGLLLLGAQSLSAETFERQHARLIKENPEGLSLKISVDKHTYRLGEIIPITLTFSNDSDVEYYSETRTYDRSGRLWDIAFHVDGPPDGHSDPLETYRLGLGGGLSGGPQRLGEYSQVFTLNEWVRFDIAGDYRIYCTTTRVWALNNGSRETVNLCSQIIKVRMYPAQQVFIRKTVSDALQNLKSDDDEGRRRAIRTLRFLATNESVEALLPFLGGEDTGLYFDAFAGVIGSRDWAHARQVLDDRMDDPDIVVNSYYVRAMAHVCLPRQEHLIAWDPNNTEASHKRYMDLAAKKEAIEKSVLGRLLSVHSRKTGRALAMACSVLLERGFESPSLKRRLAQSFWFLTEGEQEDLLRHRWEQIQCPESQSVVRRIVEAGPRRREGRYPGFFSCALLCYKQFEPNKARPMIIEDIKRPRPWLSDEVLLSLPDENLPEIENVLVGNLSRSCDTFKVAVLIERYATAQILPQVIEFYRKNEGCWACSIQASLLRYWVKHDRSRGLAAVIKAVDLREHTRCYTSVLGDVLSSDYGPDAEEIAISYLDDKEPDVVADVIRVLAHKGTVHSIEPLLAKLVSLKPEKKEETLPQACFTEASIYREIVNCFMYNDRWQLSDEQRVILKECLRTDRDREMYKRRFEPDQKVK